MLLILISGLMAQSLVVLSNAGAWKPGTESVVVTTNQKFTHSPYLKAVVLTDNTGQVKLQHCTNEWQASKPSGSCPAGLSGECWVLQCAFPVPTNFVGEGLTVKASWQDCMRLGSLALSCGSTAESSAPVVVAAGTATTSLLPVTSTSPAVVHSTQPVKTLEVQNTVLFIRHSRSTSFPGSADSDSSSDLQTHTPFPWVAVLCIMAAIVGALGMGSWGYYKVQDKRHKEAHLMLLNSLPAAKYGGNDGSPSLKPGPPFLNADPGAKYIVPPVSFAPTHQSHNASYESYYDANDQYYHNAPPNATHYYDGQLMGYAAYPEHVDHVPHYPPVASSFNGHYTNSDYIANHDNTFTPIVDQGYLHRQSSAHSAASSSQPTADEPPFVNTESLVLDNNFEDRGPNDDTIKIPKIKGTSTIEAEGAETPVSQQYHEINMHEPQHVIANALKIDTTDTTIENSEMFDSDDEITPTALNTKFTGSPNSIFTYDEKTPTAVAVPLPIITEHESSNELQNE